MRHMNLSVRYWIIQIRLRQLGRALSHYWWVLVLLAILINYMPIGGRP